MKMLENGVGKMSLADASLEMLSIAKRNLINKGLGNVKVLLYNFLVTHDYRRIYLAHYPWNFGDFLVILRLDGDD